MVNLGIKISSYKGGVVWSQEQSKEKTGVWDWTELSGLRVKDKERQIKRDWLRKEIRQRLLEGLWTVLPQVTGG